MRKLFTLILSAYLLSSCLTVGQIQRNCDKFAAICVTEKETVIEYRDTTIYLTDTIRVPLPKDTVNIIDTVTIIDNKVYYPETKKYFGIVAVKAGITNSILNVSAWLTDSTILYPRIDTVKLPGAIQIKTVTDTVIVKHVPRWCKILLGIVIAVVLLGIVYFVLKLKFKVFTR